MKSILTLLEEVLVYTSNRWADRKEKRRDGPTEPGAALPIGWIIDEDGRARRRFDLPAEQRARHLYVLGATGSGKTTLLLRLLTQDVAEGRSIAVIDLRGDLVDRILELIAAAEPQPDPASITLLDLRDTGRIVGFNPLSGAGEPHSRAYLVLDAIKSHADSWGIQLDETLRNSLIALAEANLSLIELEPLLTDDLFRLKVPAQSTDPLPALQKSRIYVAASISCIVVDAKGYLFGVAELAGSKKYAKRRSSSRAEDLSGKIHRGVNRYSSSLIKFGFQKVSIRSAIVLTSTCGSRVASTTSLP